VYNYAHVPWIAPHQKQMPEEAMPTGHVKYQMFKQTTRLLLEAGYVYIGMDHFAKPNDELALAWDAGTLHRNFQGYTTRAGQAELVGMGLSSISSWEGHFSQNLKKLSTYYAALDADILPTWRGYALSQDDKLRRHVISRLMCDNRLSFSDVNQRFGIVFEDYFAASLEKLAPLLNDGLASIEAGVLELSPVGRVFSRNIAMCFDAHLPPASSATSEAALAKPLFSKTL
jgi:oxygen-independent coproporphyrinogen-3 oxidase